MRTGSFPSAVRMDAGRQYTQGQTPFQQTFPGKPTGALKGVDFAERA
jgi:hypothetical protein